MRGGSRYRAESDVSITAQSDAELILINAPRKPASMAERLGGLEVDSHLVEASGEITSPEGRVLRPGEAFCESRRLGNFILWLCT
jgi:hypothetical protein